MKKLFLCAAVLISFVYSGVCFAEENESKIKKEVVVYFDSTKLGNKDSDHLGEVAGLPWRYASYINHAGWEIRPADGTTENSFERRNSGLGARTEFEIVSSSPKTDFEDTAGSKYETGLARNHFTEYEYVSKRYPDVKILLSIGGWKRSGYFSEMAYTEEGRESCIKSIVEILKTYTWLSGVDIDWEYPGASLDGERKPFGDNQGCPIFGTVQEDKNNFALFLKELRDAMENEFGTGEKKLTACASSSATKVLPCQDWASACDFLDLINVMTYEMVTPESGRTGHSSGLSEIKQTVRYLEKRGIPKNKICIGTQIYGVAFKMKKVPKTDFIGTECDLESPEPYGVGRNSIIDFENNLANTSKTGWHKIYDSTLGGAFLYNDSMSSKYSKWFISYESDESLNAKLDYILANELGGIAVWESTFDEREHKVFRLMSKTFR